MFDVHPQLFKTPCLHIFTSRTEASISIIHSDTVRCCKESCIKQVCRANNGIFQANLCDLGVTQKYVHTYVHTAITIGNGVSFVSKPSMLTYICNTAIPCNYVIVVCNVLRNHENETGTLCFSTSST